jgi:hypothetical protein
MLRAESAGSARSNSARMAVASFRQRYHPPPADLVVQLVQGPYSIFLNGTVTFARGQPLFLPTWSVGVRRRARRASQNDVLVVLLFYQQSVRIHIVCHIIIYQGSGRLRHDYSAIALRAGVRPGAVAVHNRWRQP